MPRRPARAPDRGPRPDHPRSVRERAAGRRRPLGGSAESLLDRRTGLLVDASRPDAIASALLELLADPVRARAMGAAGRRWVLDTWTWDRAAERLAALLRGEPAPDPMIEPWG
ncbi:glycosyltransferase [Actinomadura yumaensis]|uniref:glycosyltransferase n=1 Tax=Actinomadura yumaensis TaxID=111807 RepID=UPI00360CD02E